MATTANLSSIIRYYAEKQDSGFIDFRDFCAYIKKYAEHHVEEQAELVKYLGESSQTVAAELQGLADKKLASLINTNNKKTIISISYYAAKYTAQYQQMLKNENILFPILSDLPKEFPAQILERKVANHYLPSILNKEDLKSPFLYVLEFTHEISPLLLPACIPLNALITISQKKIRRILQKDEFHDYLLKKLKTTNPAKEISIKNFFQQFVDTDDYQYTEFTEEDDYYIWNQTLFYIHQDFEKIQDRTSEDANILQAVQILEIYSTCLKELAQNEKKRSDAINEMEAQLETSPYFYSMNQILKFQDKSGRTLFGQYTENDLKEFLEKMTTEGEEKELPPLLIFKVASGTRYYVLKKKVFQVILRLCNEAHGSISKELEESWHKSLLNYERLPEMSNSAEFELCLQELVEKKSPVLFALLNANFTHLLSYEKENEEISENFHLFVNGKLVSYSELLMLKNSKILANAKSRLPFFYTIPILSWIVRLFNSKNKKKPVKKSNHNAAEEILNKKDDENTQKSKKMSKTELLAASAKDISKELIPEGSTVDRELDYLIRQWNKMISEEAYNNLIDDVNHLICDYTRRIVKTLSGSTFTRERVENLARILVKTPNMQKIKEEKALTEYVILYILRLVSNF